VCMCARVADLVIRTKVEYFLYWPVVQHEADGFVGFPQASLCLACRFQKWATLRMSLHLLWLATNRCDEL